MVRASLSSNDPSVSLSNGAYGTVRASLSADVQSVSTSVCNHEDDYSVCAKREEAPSLLLAPSAPPAAISSLMDRSENMLSSAVANPASDESPQAVLLASTMPDTSDNESEQNTERRFTVQADQDDVDDAAEEDVDEDDERENGDLDVYQAASEVCSYADVDSYRYAQLLDIDDAEMSDYYAVAPVSEPTSFSVSTSGGYWRAQVVPDADADSSGSRETVVDHGLEGNSDESAAAPDGSQSPESESLYCAVNFSTNTN